jgi:hypothetical protein
MNIESIVTALVTTSFFSTMTVFLIKSGVGNFFIKNVEKYKDEIAIASEQRQFTFERKLQDFNVISIKKHEMYPGLYKVLKKAHTNLTIFELTARLPDIENVGSIEEFLANREVPISFFSKVYEKWKDKDVNNFFILQRTLMLYNYEKVNKDISNAYELFYETDIYLPDDISRNIKSLLRNMIYLITAYGNYAENGLKTKENEILDNQIKSELEDYMGIIRKQIKQEILMGNYERKIE